MIIIFGLRVFFRTVGQGTFHCPQCGGDRQYRLRSGRQFFHLFFVPLIPLRRVGQHVQCRTCRTRYNTSVLEVPTTQQLAAVPALAMRAVISAVVRSGDVTSPAVRQQAIGAVQQAGAPYSDADLDVDLSRPFDLVRHELAQLVTGIAPEARENFLAQGVHLALADGPLSESERQTLLAVGSDLGLTPAQTYGVITFAEQGAQRP